MAKFTMPWTVRVFSLCIVYAVGIVGAHTAAYLIRFEFHLSGQTWQELRDGLAWILPLNLGLLTLFGQFRSLLTYFSLPDARNVALAFLLSAVVQTGVWYSSEGGYAPPRSIVVLSFVLDTVALYAIRIAFRLLRARPSRGGGRTDPTSRVILIGAGDVGAHLANEMMSRRGLRMTPVAFLDDDPHKWNTFLHGVPILGKPELLTGKDMDVDKAVISMPSASGKRIREIVHILNEARIKFEIVPSMEQLMTGVVKISQIRPVQIEDLLGRERVALDTNRIRDLVQNRVVMVTGAGGSIGSELCRQIANLQPARLLLVERCEVQMFQIEQELLTSGLGAAIVPLVADIMDETRMNTVFQRFKPDLVFHAAAHKHVPMMEHQPYEAVRNNAIGTQAVADLCSRYGIARFVLISTDKAINPTNVMGATKRLAEVYLQALQGQGGTSTKFMAVRFGNVLGSSGSVIPTFKRQIAAGGPVTVTHPEVTRYFMTVHEAVGLVLQCAAQGDGGEIFVLDMGKPVKIVDLARQLIELSGLQPDIDISLEFTGLRPGEKLYEELSYDTENVRPTSHPKIMRFVGPAGSLALLQDALGDFERSAAALEPDQLKLQLKRLIPEYQPHLAGL